MMWADGRQFKFGRYDLKAGILVKFKRIFTSVAPNVICFLVQQMYNGKVKQAGAYTLATIFFCGAHAAHLVTIAFKLFIGLQMKRNYANQFAFYIIT